MGSGRARAGAAYSITLGPPRLFGHPDLGSRPDATLPGKAPGLKQPGGSAEEGLVTGSASNPSTPSAAALPTSTEDAGRCPRCKARVRPEYAWCALCHLDLHPPAQDPEGPQHAEAPAPEHPIAGRPARDGDGADAADGADTDEDERAAAEAEALVLLHHLRASESGAGMPALLSSLGVGGRAVLALGIGAVLVLLLVGGSAVLGLLF
jgi:hypothetical protein